MKTKMAIALIIVTIAFSLFMIFFAGVRAFAIKTSALSQHQTSVPLSEPVLAQAVSSSPSAATVTATMEHPVLQSAPSRERYRREAVNNPHGIPPSLQAVALEMADAMRQAKRDQQFAQTFFDRLERCALDQSKTMILTIRALCADNARELAELYPEHLKQKFEVVYNRLPRKIRLLLMETST